MKKSVEVHEEHKAVNTVLMAISRIEDIQATSMNALVRVRVIELLPLSVSIIHGRGWTGNRTRRRIAAHGNIPIHIAVRQRGEGITRSTNGKGRCNRVVKSVDF